MAWGYVAVGAATLVGGYLSSEGAKGAAETQAGAGREAIAQQQAALAEQKKLMEPFRTAGVSALDRLVKGLGPGGEFEQPFAMTQALPTFKPFQMQESETQKFTTAKALDAMRAQMQLGGQALSTQAITGAGELAGKIGSQYEQQAFNQWLLGQQQEFGQAQQARQQAGAEWQQRMAPIASLASMGYGAAGGTAGDVGATGRDIAGLQTGIGNVQAAGQIGQAGATAGAVSNLGQMYMLNQILNPSSPTTGGGAGTAADLTATGMGGQTYPSLTQSAISTGLATR